MNVKPILARRWGWLVALGSVVAGCVSMGTPWRYPITRMVEQTDNFHGTIVRDPYRWLEDDQSEETRRWIEAQNEVTFGYLSQISERPIIRQRLQDLWNYERHGVPVRRGAYYFFTRNDGLQNQSVVYRQDSLASEPVVLLDPNPLSPDGTVALSGYAVSDDGRRLAYGLATAGSDWQEWRVRDVASGQDLPDVVKWVKFSSASWLPDGSGFFYSRYDEPPPGAALTKANYFHKLYFHRLGSAQSEDVLVYHRPDQKDWGFQGVATDDGRYLVVTATQGTDPRNRVFYRDLAEDKGPVRELLGRFDASYDFIDNDGPVFWFLTDRDAPRSRVIAIDVRRPEPEEWKEIIPETDATLRGVSVVGDQFVASYLRDAHSEVRCYRLDGELVRKVDLPGLGSVSGFPGRRGNPETFYNYTSFTQPGTVYRLDVESGKTEVVRKPALRFEPEGYETRQVFYGSKDGTRIPMFVTHRRGLRLHGRNPTLLYGYGGFNIPLTPSFSPAVIVWLEMGGVYAVPNLRGGGEYGRSWHLAGTKLKKQNVFDDFVAAAEWLIDRRYTGSRKLAISGGSNGGLLVGACMTQRPELFRAALPAVGVMDMLRFHRFTIGWAWTSDYGSPDVAEEFQALWRYSPLHNLKPGTRYPSTLVTTGDHDDRVVPAHSFKFAAALQAAHAGRNPVLIRIETRAGHGAGKPTSKLIDETADRWAFLAHELAMDLDAW